MSVSICRRDDIVEKLKVLVVDDSVIYRKIISEAVVATDIAEVKHNACSGYLALKRLQHGKYDVVILDVNMPEIDGWETLKRIKASWPEVSVIMISASGGENIKSTSKFSNNEVEDFIIKPLEDKFSKNIDILRDNLFLSLQKISMKRIGNGAASCYAVPETDVSKEVISKGIVTGSEDIKQDVSKEFVLKGTVPGSVVIGQESRRSKSFKLNYRRELDINIRNGLNSKDINKRLTGVDLLLVASSTGGPNALEKLFVSFKENINVPLLIVQHMPPKFTNVLAKSLDVKTNIFFTEAQEGEIIRPGLGIVAPGGLHMMVATDKALKKVVLSKSEYVNGVRPSADVLFKSVAQEYQGARILAVILTGMGCDGLEGVSALKEKCFCYCITQSEDSCVVYGMPRSVFESGLSDEVLDVENMADRIQHIIEHGS